MNNLSKQFSYDEARIQAQILLKNLSSTENKEAFKRIEQIFKNDIPQKIQLKHTLLVIANEYGFDSWLNLKNYFYTTGKTNFNPIGGGFINQWFSNYNEAKNILKQSRGYLLPYKNQFFICESGYIEYLGLDQYTQEWLLINNNWVEPINMIAWNKLNNIYSIKYIQASI